MPLQKQEITLLFTEGVDTKTDDKIAQKAEVVDNINIDKTGTYRKRFGFDKLNGANDVIVGNPEQLSSADETIALITTTQCLLYSDAGVVSDPLTGSSTIQTGKKLYNRYGTAQRVGKLNTYDSLLKFTTQAIPAGNYVFTVADNGKTANLNVLDSVTGSLIKTFSLFPGAVFGSDSNYLYYMYVNGGNINCTKIALSDLAVSVEYTISLTTYNIEWINLKAIGGKDVLLTGADKTDYKPRFVLVKSGAVTANYKDAAAAPISSFGGRYSDGDYDSANDTVYMASVTAITGGHDYRVLKYVVPTTTPTIYNKTFLQTSTAFSVDLAFMGGCAYNPITGKLT